MYKCSFARSKIADAALPCFTRNGFAATSMADIIAESGLSAGSIYSHFESKTDLIRFVAAMRLESGVDQITTEVPASTGIVAPGAVLRMLLSGVGEQRTQASLLLQVWTESTRAPVAAPTRKDRTIAMIVHRPWCVVPVVMHSGYPEHGIATGNGAEVLQLIQGVLMEGCPFWRWESCSLLRCGLSPHDNEKPPT